MYTHVHMNTQLASVSITQQYFLGADDGEIEITGHLHFSNPLEPFHLCCASPLHLSTCLHTFYPGAKWSLCFLPPHIARYGVGYVTFLQMFYFDMFCIFSQGFLPKNPMGLIFRLTYLTHMFQCLILGLFLATANAGIL